MTFLGTWLVSEYVYNANGHFVGVLQQRRELRQLTNDRVQVIQHYQPAPHLSDHPMGQFTGTPIFELSLNGRTRYYDGPTVIGMGHAWGEGVSMGHGVWPELGHNFTSFTALAAPHRQLTRNTFFNATEVVANVVGVATPAQSVTATQARNTWPQLDGPHWPGDIASTWQGSLRTFSPTGIVESEIALQRHYSKHLPNRLHWADHWQGKVNFALELKPQPARLQVKGIGEPGVTLDGVGKQFGWLLDVEAVSQKGVRLIFMELLDGHSGHLIGLRRWLRDEELERVEVILLRPSGYPNL